MGRSCAGLLGRLQCLYSAIMFLLHGDARIEELKTLLPQCLLPTGCGWGGGSPGFCAIVITRPARGTVGAVAPTSHASLALRKERRSMFQPRLPIRAADHARKDEIVAAIRAHQVIVIAGETGSGKTTQIPKMCLKRAWESKPRSVARSPAGRGAFHLAPHCRGIERLMGREVGCKSV